MTLQKWKNHSLVTDAEFIHNLKLGYPVEVFCLTTCQTVAYGKIQDLSDDTVIVHGRRFRRNGCAFFGFPGTAPYRELKTS
ncbi:hypothetical protein CR205_07650 [Alteribacter lacisalsi]|uniref:Uncharacterized protein n=1 Tax=Alteribacter lacisalsi TaxID=2045244 RepID=A0A2W0HC80_9BACI|nr:hypothetical protein [Alteribacter lacisalsi]PYZ98456.1 hypothetical protein CR205_07650 [Alteribacter lacisalsi]